MLYVNIILNIPIYSYIQFFINECNLRKVLMEPKNMKYVDILRLIAIAFRMLSH
jgi:hypothetical protein